MRRSKVILHSLTRMFYNEAELLNFAANVAHVIQSQTIIFLSGPLGAGKTTFVRGFLRGLDYHDKVKSPTYSLVEPYEVHGKTILHADLYRLQTKKELEEIGLSEDIAAADIALIEWPELGVAAFPEPDLVCQFVFTTGARMMQIKAHTVNGETILSLLNGGLDVSVKQ